jgi:hypothetical protein
MPGEMVQNGPATAIRIASSFPTHRVRTNITPYGARNHVQALAVDPVDPSTLYAALDTVIATAGAFAMSAATEAQIPVARFPELDGAG